MITELWQIVGNAAFDDNFYEAINNASNNDLPGECQSGNSMGGETSNLQALCLPSLSLSTNQDYDCD